MTSSPRGTDARSVVPDRERELFADALEHASPEERAAFLSQACGSDHDLRERVEALLRQHDQAGDFLDGGGKGPGRDLLESAAPGEGPGTALGRYKLLEVIGEGGFGVVYMAEQREPVRRKVALKIIKLGMDTRQVIGRFEAERQALALMDHPNIARVLDGGTTETGRPYFVMELVRGMPITQFCDERRLGALDRLELFLSVCGAIQHAHQKGIIHRDIKPSNVLVTLYDDRPVPKVIDFGIAKALQGDLTDKTVFTRFQEFLGTPAYMSPEQTQLSGLDADTRSDIYALGVLLYELLTGRPPFDSKELLTAGLDELRRRIREEEPPRPSTRLRTLSVPDADTVARDRSTQPARLASLLQGDLDWITLKCLEKDRTRRYESVSALAQDIRRHLANEPVSAAAPGVAYRLRKLARRHRTAVTIGIGFIVMLFAAVLVSSAFAVRAFRAERTARREAAVAAAVSRFLNEDLFALADGGAEPDPELRMRTLLDRAASQVESRFRDQPSLQAAVRATLGRTYANLGQFEAARQQWQKAYEIQRETLGPEDRQTLLTLSDLAFVQARMDPREEALRLGQQVLADARRRFGDQDPLTLQCLSRLAYIHYRRGESAQALAAAGTVVASARAAPDLETGELTRALDLFGRMLARGGERDRGEQHIRESLEIAQRRLGETHPVALRAKNALAAFYYDHRFKLAEAEALYLAALDQQRLAFGEAHPTTLNIRNNLALLYAYREPKRPELALAHRLRVLRFRPLLEAPSSTIAALEAMLADIPDEALRPPAALDPAAWRHTAARPAARWTDRDFEPRAWLAGLPTGSAEGWLRQTFAWPDGPEAEPFVTIRGGSRFEVFLNGHAAQPVCSGGTSGAGPLHVFLFDTPARLTLRSTNNVIAVHGIALADEHPPDIRLQRLPELPEPESAAR